MYRRLTQEESDKFYGAMAHAIDVVPAFRDAFALLNPYYNDDCPTSAVDKWARVQVGPTFFEKWTANQRATVIIHETLHVINDHFLRDDYIVKASGHEVSNIAGDLEINSTINTLGAAVDLSFGILPGREPYMYDLCLSLEQYYELIKKDIESGKLTVKGRLPCNGKHSQDGDGEPCDGSCQQEGEECGTVDKEGEEAADGLGIEKTSATEKNIAKNNTIVRLQDEKKKKSGYGRGSSDSFLDLVLEMLAPAKVPWQTILRPIIGSSREAIINGRQDHSFRRVNRRRSGASDLIFPGMVTYVPKIMFAIDTSGSMDKSDYMALLVEVEDLIKGSSRNEGFSVFPVDTEVKDVQTVKSVRDINLVGGGGTDMGPALRYVNELSAKKRPDLFVLATDGFVPWDSYLKELEVGESLYRHVLLITNHEGYENVPQEVRDHCLAVIDIAND